MTIHRSVWTGLGALLFLAAIVEAQQSPPPLDAPPGNGVGDGQEYEVQTSGPLHEAYAEQYSLDPTPGLVVETQPPEPIDEVPPDVMPEGENVVWIPGYWAWDPERRDYLWISGLWRNVPPQRTWVPGYWRSAENGHQWVSGFWASAGSPDVGYLPLPPENLESGPNVAAPSGDFFWVPGCWIWTGGDYQWRPGYWAAASPEWVWIPDGYSWTPHGCVFVDGYWDRPFDARGLLFAPVYYPEPVYARAGYRYTPGYAWNTRSLLLSLFVSPRSGHYFYGNYYAGDYGGFPLQPWYAFDRRARYHDPLLTYYQWSYGRRGVDLVDRLGAWNDFYRTNDARRPPRTLADQTRLLAQLDGTDRAANATALTVAEPLADLARSSTVPMRQLDGAARERIGNVARQLDDFRRQRSEIEVDADERGQQDRGRLRLPEGLVNRGEPRGRTEPGERPGERPAEQSGERPAERPGDRPTERRGPNGPPERPNDNPDREDAPRVQPGGQPDIPERFRPREGEPRFPRFGNERPQTDSPTGNRPRTEPPREAPRPETPRTETPRPEGPRPNVPRTDVPNRGNPNRPPGVEGGPPRGNDPVESGPPGRGGRGNPPGPGGNGGLGRGNAPDSGNAPAPGQGGGGPGGPPGRQK